MDLPHIKMTLPPKKWQGHLEVWQGLLLVWQGHIEVWQGHTFARKLS
jgi:hypothetical protein